MNIRIPADTHHSVYGSNGMSGKAKYGFEQLGHTIVQGAKYDSKEDLMIIFGSTSNFKDFNTDAKKIFVSHGVQWFRGFDALGNQVLKDNFEESDVVVYQSEFAKHMTEKAFGVKPGYDESQPIVLNAAIPDFPEQFPTWKEGEEVHIVVCAVWRAWKRLHEVERLTRFIASKGYKIRVSVIGRDPGLNGLYDRPLKGDNYEIEYLGMHNHEFMKELYHTCHMFWQLSFNDFSPATALEAQAWGLPVLAVNSGGIKDGLGDSGVIIENDPFIDYPFNIQNERVLPLINDDIFMEGFEKILNNLEDYQGKNKEHVENEANAVRQAEKMIQIYETIR